MPAIYLPSAHATPPSGRRFDEQKLYAERANLIASHA